MRLPSLVALAALAAVACQRDAAKPALPEGSAGEILSHAMDAAGGWERWRSLHDVAFVATLSLFDPAGNLASQSIGLQKSPLHTGSRARFDSIGMSEAVTFGFDGSEVWVEHGEKATLPDPERVALVRFNMVSELFWFSLPFSLAEIPATIEDLGDDEDDDGRWQRLKVTLRDGAPEAPADWFVVYFDARSALIGRVFGHITAEFLSHSLWVGRWLDYRDLGGLKKERRRRFFPADDEGRPIGGLAVERLVEDVRFNNGFPADLFRKPLAANGGSEA